MNTAANWLSIFVGFVCILGFGVSLILYYANRDKSFTPRLLAAILFCLSYSLSGYLLYITGEFVHYPHLYRTPVFLSLCAAPLTYIYVRSNLDQAFQFKKSDFLFFLPALLYTAQFIPFYLQPADVKLQYIRAAMADKSVGVREPEALLPGGLGILFRTAYSLIILSMACLLLVRWKKGSRKSLLEIGQNQEIFQWLKYLSLVLLANFGALLLGSVFVINRIMERLPLPTVTLSFAVFFICGYLLFKPNILYGLTGWVPTAAAPAGESTTTDWPAENAVRRQYISLEQGNSFRARIKDHFDRNRPFLKQRYSIRDLSGELGIPSYLLSAFINQEYGKNFSEFINDHRVDYLVEMAGKDPNYLLTYTLEVIGQMGGFSSRTAFIAAVKRKTGKTPSDLFGKS